MRCGEHAKCVDSLSIVESILGAAKISGFGMANLRRTFVIASGAKTESASTVCVRSNANFAVFVGSN